MSQTVAFSLNCWLKLIMNHITVQYCTVLHYTILYYTILYYTNTMLCCTILYYTIYYTILYYTLQYYIILYYCIVYYTILVGRDSVVGVASRYGLDSLGIESWWGSRFSTPIQTSPGTHPASCTMGTGSFPGDKAARAWC